MHLFDTTKTKIEKRKPNRRRTRMIRTATSFSTTPRGGATPLPRRARPLLLLFRSNPPLRGGGEQNDPETPDISPTGKRYGLFVAPCRAQRKLLLVGCLPFPEFFLRRLWRACPGWQFFFFGRSLGFYGESLAHNTRSLRLDILNITFLTV